MYQEGGLYFVVKKLILDCLYLLFSIFRNQIIEL